MRIKNLVRISIDNIMMHIWSFLGSLFLPVLVLLLLAMLVLVQSMTSNIRRSLEKSGLKYIDSLGFIMTEDDMAQDAIDAIMQTDGVDGAAYVWEPGGNYTDAGLLELHTIQADHSVFRTESDTSLGVYMIEISQTITNIWDMKLSDGVLPNELDDDVSKTYIYLGGAYDGKIEVGTEYNSSVFQTTFVVAGIMEDGLEMPSAQLYDVNIYDMTESFPLSYEVLIVKKSTEVQSKGVYFGFSNETSFTKTKREVMQRLVELGYKNIDIINMGETIRNVEKKGQSINKNLIQMLALVGITFCMILFCFQLLNFMRRSREYGLMMAEGFSLADLEFMTIMENFLKMFVAYGLAILITWWMSIYLLGMDTGMLYVFRSIYLGYILPILAVVCIVFVIFASSCPIWIMRKHSPIDLMGKVEE